MNEQLDAAFAAGIQAASLRNPIQEWLSDAFTGGESDAGVAVNYNTSLSYVSVWAAVSLISKDIAKVPLNVLRLESDGDRVPDESHYVYWLLNQDANQYMSSMVFRMLLQSHVLLWGNGYALIERDGTGRALDLCPLLPDRTCPRVMESGELAYETRLADNTTEVIPASDIFHLKGMSWDGMKGHSVITKARRQIGLGIAQERHGARSFKNNASPSITLETDQRLSEDDANALLMRWKEKQGGDNVNSPALLTNGVTVKPFSMSNEDAQWLESRDFTRTDVAHWFNLPPHKISKSTELPYNSLIAAEQAYRNDTLHFWYRAWEDEAERKLIPNRIRRSRSLCICHDVQELMFADLATKMEFYKTAREIGVLSANEIRRKIGMPSIEQGNDYSNPNTSSPTAPEPEPATAETTSAMRSAMAHTLRAMVKGESDRATNAAKRTKDFVGWCDSFYSTYTSKVRDAMEPLIYAYSTLPGVVCNYTAAEVSEQFARDSKDALLAAAGVALDQKELTQHVTETVAEWPARAEAMAIQICEVSYVPGE